MEKRQIDPILMGSLRGTEDSLNVTFTEMIINVINHRGMSIHDIINVSQNIIRNNPTMDSSAREELMIRKLFLKEVEQITFVEHTMFQKMDISMLMKYWLLSLTYTEQVYLLRYFG